jgi:spore coat polysaccharide biosynthesis protein SpsF (cytidylyltransferase family)
LLLIIQARSSSKRFPNKVLYPIKKKPVILRVIHNALKSKQISKLLIATSNKRSDNALVNFLKKKNFNVFRGSLNNVADRLLKAAQINNSKYFIRVSGDSPLIDYKIIDRAIKIFKKNKRNKDLITNVFPRTFPSGQSVEIIKTKILKENLSEMSKSEKEHVTIFFYKYFERFRILNFKNFSRFKKNKMSLDFRSDLPRIKKYI